MWLFFSTIQKNEQSLVETPNAEVPNSAIIWSRLHGQTHTQSTNDLLFLPPDRKKDKHPDGANSSWLDDQQSILGCEKPAKFDSFEKFVPGIVVP
jgi:hypothetical protein